MPKIEGFYHLKKMEPSDTITLVTLVTPNFSHLVLKAPLFSFGATKAGSPVSPYLLLVTGGTNLALIVLIKRWISSRIIKLHGTKSSVMKVANKTPKPRLMAIGIKNWA